jgi:hypothetical protein
LRAIRSEGIVAGGVEEYAGFFDGFPVHLGVDENTMIGCSILRAFGEGWDKQIPGKELRGRAVVSHISPKTSEMWGTRALVVTEKTEL